MFDLLDDASVAKGMLPILSTDKQLTLKITLHYIMRARDFSKFKRIYHQLLADYRPFVWRHLRKYQCDYDLEPHEQQQQQSQYCAPFYKFDNKQCLFDWAPSSDIEIGGDSTSEIIYNDNEKYLTLKGKIDTTQKHVLQAEPYVEMKLFPFRSWELNLFNFNLIRVKMRTYGDICRIQCQFLTSAEDKHMYGYGIVVDQTKEWHQFELPFVHFRKNKNDDSGVDIKKFNRSPLISGFSIKIASETPKQVQVDVKQIQVLWVPYVQVFCKQYKRPIFYHRIDDYKNVDRVNNGREQLVRIK